MSNLLLSGGRADMIGLIFCIDLFLSFRLTQKGSKCIYIYFVFFGHFPLWELRKFSAEKNYKNNH